MEEIWDKERRVMADNAADQLRVDEDEDDDDEEALSLSDLPLIPKKDPADEDDEEDPDLSRESQIQAEEFDFCSFSKHSEMCTADEVFFQGQILPLRHSVSSERGSSFLQRHPTRPVSRSESMDRIYSGGLISSRSNSISSHQSSSSGSSVSNPGPKFKPRFNQFHSLPSPSPRIRFHGSNQRPNSVSKTHRNNPTKKSSVWNMFRLGILNPPQEMAFLDLKSRCPSNISASTNSRTNFGSRNSTSSHGSSITSSKRKARTLLGGGCRCSSDAVATVPTRVITIKRSASEGGADALRRRRQGEPERSASGKKQWSHHHRTFEWIKQLSLQGAPEDDDDDDEA